jgi:osmoprotectant transport system substrate-binding protein
MRLYRGATVLALLGICLASGCAFEGVARRPAEPPQAGASASGGAPVVRVGSTNFAEQVILAELYAQVLEAGGYRVERKLNLGSREIVEPALESGQIDMYVEYLATLLRFLKGTPTSEAAESHRALQEALRPKGIAALEFANAVNTNAFAVTRATAERLGLAKLSDVRPVAGQLVLGGPPECPQRPFCLPGLEERYGITFKDFKPLDVGGPITVAALEGRQIDVGLVFSTDAVIKQKGFVVLEDDKHLQLADNVVPVVREELLRKAPDDFRATVNGITARLSTDDLIELNRQVGIDRRDPNDAARDWLTAKGLLK